MMNIKGIKLNPLLTSVFFLIIYLLLPTSNSSIDSWAYALYVKQAKELFLPHHLLNGVMGLLWVRAVNFFFEIDVMRLMLALNAVFAAGILYILGITLKELGASMKKTIAWVAFVGSSWAIMRYATENEVYIFPIFFSLLGSYFFVRFQKTRGTKEIFLSGLFVATACLFHQIMFFWWLALLVGATTRREKKFFWSFSLPALIVPIIYVLAIVFYYDRPFSLESIMHFVLNDYYSGAAGISTGMGAFLLLIVGIFRSFIQLHGYIANIHFFSVLFYAGGILTVVFFVWSLKSFRFIEWRWRSIKVITVWVHLLAIVLQILFAFLSSGNAEFMVMIPLLLAIVLAQLMENETRIIGLIAVAMLIWNLSFGLIPLNTLDLDNNKSISERILKEQKEPIKSVYILFNRPRVENEVEYHLGSSPQSIVSGIKYQDISNIKALIDSSLIKGVAVYTDCINRPKTISRETLTVSNNFENQFMEYTFSKADSINTLTGKYYLYIISKK